MMKLFLPMVCLTSVCLAVSPVYQSRTNLLNPAALNTFVSYKKMADNEHRNGNLLNAITHYKEAIKNLKGNEDFDFDDNEEEEEEGEENNVEVVVETDGISLSSCRLSLALCLLKQGQFCESMKQCTKILQTKPRPNPEV